MKLFVLLLVLPVVLAGDFAKMWDEMEKELETKGWGQEPKEVPAGGDKKVVEEKQNSVGQEPNGSEQKPKNGSDPEGGEEKPKGWGDESKGWGEKPKENEEEKGGKGNKTKSLFEDFKSWLAEQEKEKKEQENDKKEQDERKQFMKSNLEKFKEYMKMKQYKEKQEKEAEESLKKEKEKVEMKKLLAEKLYNASNEYKAQKMQFTQDIATHFLEFCECDSSKEIFERITSGQFGDQESLDKGWDFSIDDSEEDMDDNNASLSINNGTSSGNYSTEYPKTDDAKLKETVKMFAKLTKSEQVKYVLHDLVKVMCTSASTYMGKMKEVEAALVEYKKKYNS